MKNKIKKSLALLIILFIALNLNANYASADAVTFDALGYFNDILSDLGVDKAELKYTIETMNVSRRKKNPPTVSISFNPPNPVPGEKVTVMATPTYFMNDIKDLYFTWFLKSKICDTTSNPTSEETRKCDLNDSGTVSIEDYKIKAMRIIASNDFDWEKAAYTRDSDNDGYQSRIGGNDQGGKNNYCYIHDTESGDEYQITCGHLFPNAPSSTTGDGTFEINEERFWHTDPASDDTAGTGNGDEANITGMGINSFTWTYEEGDEVGVVVEGVSIEPTQTNDSSYRTMWAMPKTMCDVSVSHSYPKTSTETISVTADSPIPGQTTTVTETTVEDIDSAAANIATISTTVTTITTVTDSLTGATISTGSVAGTPTYDITDIAEDISIEDIEDASDLNRCLYDNLIAPAEGGGAAERLKVDLSYSPKSPINDPDPVSNSGDQIIVHSSILNAQDSNYLKYTWQVYQNDELNPDSWGEPLLKSALPESSQTAGLGLNTFKFKLNFPNSKKYLKVKLTVTENIGSGVVREGHSDVVIPVYSTSSQIRAYETSVSDSLNISLSSNQICQEGIEKSVCPVSKNQIVGITIPPSGLSDFSWTIDGTPFTYQECFFEGCDSANQTNIAFFPVLKNKGERYTITLTATNQTTGQKIDLTKVFEVADPKIKISCADSSCQPVLLGNYIDLDGKQWPDLSQMNFWSAVGSSPKLSAAATGFSAPATSYSWFVNGLAIISANAVTYGYSLGSDGILTLSPKFLGESYDVTVNVPYTQSNLVKKALNRYWGVTYDQFYETVVSDSINVEMVNSTSPVATASNQKILASIYSSLPSYLAFLLRIVLTSFIILIGSVFILSLFPKIKNEYE